MITLNSALRWFSALLLGFAITTPAVQAATETEASPGPLFRVTLIESDDGYRLNVKPTNSSRSYPYTGIKINHPDFVFDNAPGCNSNHNGWCLYNNQPNTNHTFRVRKTSNQAPNTPVTIQVALNALNMPISVQQVKVQAATAGRIAGYLYGWAPAPTGAELAANHYTHVLIAFGLFSTSNPGTLNLDAISGFDLAAYVQDLHDNGIQAILSIGGASTNIPDTTVSFDQAVSLATTPNDFINTMVADLTNLQSTYNLDGFDIDIEAGLNAANSFTDPTADCNDNVYRPVCNIANLAEIINTFKANSSGTMITLAPQIANMAATNAFTDIWGNYAALISITHPSLEWVAFQNYNSGCAFGIDSVCYPITGTTLTDSPDSAVAFSADLLEDWPAYSPTGQPTGFLPYEGTQYLTPPQVMIGYVVVNSEGSSDGAPPAVISVTNDAIQCLRSQEGCDNYTAPRPYPDIGGVFAWSINFDEDNSYAFSNGVYPCVVQGNCTN